MTPWHLRLHNRIVVPFVLVALVAAAAAALLTLLVVSRSFEARVSTQILNTADVISRGGFAENSAILRSVKAITGADVVTFTDDGTILVSTVASPHLGDAQVVTSAAAVGPWPGAAGGPVIRRVNCDNPCFVAYQQLSGRAGTRVAVIVEASEVSAATRAVARTMLLIAAAGLLVMVAASQVVARRVTAPIERLVAFTDAVAAGGTPPGRAKTGKDEIGRLGQSFNQMIDRVEQSQAALVRTEKLALAGMMAARVAHDIRNPLSAIKMHTQLLQGQLRGDDTSEELVSSVLREIVTVESVISDLIELSRPGELRLRPSSLNRLVTEVLRQFEPQMTYRKIVVESRLSPDLPDLQLDTARLKQAVANLLANAAEAMTAGGRASISTSVTPDRASVVLEVCDDGVGIDVALRDRVFDPFVTSKRDGVGLGLVNAKAVVEQHGGRIELSPREPRGTVARITLPLSQD